MENINDIITEVFAEKRFIDDHIIRQITSLELKNAGLDSYLEKMVTKKKLADRITISNAWYLEDEKKLLFRMSALINQFRKMYHKVENPSILETDYVNYQLLKYLYHEFVHMKQVQLLDTLDSQDSLYKILNQSRNYVLTSSKKEDISDYLTEKKYLQMLFVFIRVWYKYYQYNKLHQLFPTERQADSLALKKLLEIFQNIPECEQIMEFNLKEFYTVLTRDYHLSFFTSRVVSPYEIFTRKLHLKSYAIPDITLFEKMSLGLPIGRDVYLENIEKMRKLEK